MTGGRAENARTFYHDGRRIKKRVAETGRLHHDPGGAVQLGPGQFRVAADLRPGVLRHRNDGGVHGPLRPRPVRRGGVPAVAPAGRPDDCGGHGHQENGAAGGAALQPDARAQIRHRHGRVRDFRRAVQAGLQRAQGHRPLSSGGRGDSRLSAAAGGVDPRHHDLAGKNPEPETHRSGPAAPSQRRCAR